MKSEFDLKLVLLLVTVAAGPPPLSEVVDSLDCGPVTVTFDRDSLRPPQAGLATE